VYFLITAVAFRTSGLPRFSWSGAASAETTESSHDRCNTPHSAFYKDLAARSNEIWPGEKPVAIMRAELIPILRNQARVLRFDQNPYINLISLGPSGD
jgi:hypothetical protein